MSVPTTREDFKEYCLRALGAPVIQINVDDGQVEDRVDEALYMFQQFHMDGTAKTYLKHQITASEMTFSTAIANTFMRGEPLRGETSGASGIVHTIPTTGNTIQFYMHTGSAPFVAGEVVTGTMSLVSGTANTIVLGDMDNHWFPLDPSIIAVNRVFPPFDQRMSAEILFDPQSQFNISLLSNFTSNSIVPYVVGRQYQQLLNDTFRGRPLIRFERHRNQLHIDVSFMSSWRPGQYIIAECLVIIDPDEFASVWSDRWLLRYAIALIKRQWGTNLSKYTGLQLPGNVSLDGRSMLTEANQEVKDLEEELQNTFQLPCDFYVG